MKEETDSPADVWTDPLLLPPDWLFIDVTGSRIFPVMQKFENEAKIMAGRASMFIYMRQIESTHSIRSTGIF